MSEIVGRGAAHRAGRTPESVADLAAGRALLPASGRRRPAGALGRRPCCSSCSSRSATATSTGVSTDLGDARRARSRPRSASSCSRSPRLRRCVVPAVVVARAVAVPAALAALGRRRPRRCASARPSFALARRAGRPVAAACRARSPSGTWIARHAFPSLAYVAGAAAVVAVGKPWLNRSWRRAADLALVVLALRARDRGHRRRAPTPARRSPSAWSSARRSSCALGAPNRRPSPAVGRRRRCGTAGSTSPARRSSGREGGRAQLYTADRGRRAASFVKVYGADSRDADLLYRGYRTRSCAGRTTTGRRVARPRRRARGVAAPARAARAGVRVSGRSRRCAPLPDGSLALALEHVDGRRLDELAPDEIDAAAARRGVARSRDAARRRASRTARCAPPTCSSTGDRPVVIDLGFGAESADARLQAIDRAELLVVARRDRRPRAAVVVRGAAHDRRRTPSRPRCRTCNRSRSRARHASRRRSSCSPSCATAIATPRRERARAARAARARPAPHAGDDRRAHRPRSTCCCPSSPTSATASTRCSDANWWWLLVVPRHVDGHLRRGARSGWRAVCRSTSRSFPPSARSSRRRS